MSATSDQQKMKAMLEAIGFEYEALENDSYRVNVEFEDNRHQYVEISQICDTVGGVAFRQIFSAALKFTGKLSDALAYKLLANNHHRAVGSWALDVSKNIVYFAVKVPDTLTQAQLDALIIAVASDADRLEKKLSDEDIL